jgi:hypothetical protein
MNVDFSAVSMNEPDGNPVNANPPESSVITG